MAGNDQPLTTANVLRAYLLGTVDFEATLQLQRRLHFEITGDRSQAALVLCEHPPLITVGRNGSRGQIQWEPDELRQLGWRIRWVNRGGGCWLHLPGQLAVYCIFPVEACTEPLPGLLARFSEAVRRTLADFRIQSQTRPGGLWVGQRLIAGLGVAVRDWVSYYGMCLNVHPDLEPYSLIRCAPRSQEPMTSLARERRGLVRPAHVRELLVENLQNVFDFARVSLFSDHPRLNGCQQRLVDHRVASSRTL
jgi:lipoyl(octanoyl) transferase